MGDRIAVEVVYADDSQQITRSLFVPRGSSVAFAIEESAIARFLPADFEIRHVGIFGRKIAPSQILVEGDRIEIYRTLTLDPMEARRKRAR
jgi:hypothetical protein